MAAYSKRIKGAAKGYSKRILELLGATEYDEAAGG